MLSYFPFIISPSLPPAAILREFEHSEQERPLGVILDQDQQLEVQRLDPRRQKQ